jgi:DNA topoisomerase-1
VGEIVEKKARRGNFFYGCNKYPECDFTAPTKPVAEACPDCGSPYLLEKVTKEGTFLICPNSKAPSKSKTAAKAAATKAAKTKAKGKAKVVAAQAPAVEPGSCDFSKKIAEPQPESEPAPTLA